MLGRSPLQLGLIALAIMLATFFISFFLGWGFSVAVLLLIAAAGFLTIVAVMILGSQHGESPMSASDSHAVSVWNERVAKRRQAAAPAEDTSTEAKE
jgi:hypothetical protein